MDKSRKSEHALRGCDVYEAVVNFACEALWDDLNSAWKYGSLFSLVTWSSILSSETPVVSSWSRALCVPILGGAVFLALASTVAFFQAFDAMTTRLFVMAIATAIAAVLLGALGISIARGRGIPNWFMRTFLLSLLGLLFVPGSLEMLNQWRQGKPIDGGTLFIWLIVLLCFTDSWKTLWFHRSREI